MALSQESVISFQNQLTSIMEVLVKNAVFEITKLFESRMVEIQSVCVARREMKNASEFKAQQQLKTPEDEHEYHMNSQSTKKEFEARDEHVCTGTIDVFGRLVANSNDNITNTSTTLPGKQDNGNPLDQEFEQRWSSDLWQDGATLISGAGRTETQPVQVKQEVGQVKMHISIVPAGSTPTLRRCTTCCKLYHCPFCFKFKPAMLAKTMHHVDVHLKNALSFKDKYICRCAFTCRKDAHYHCPLCEKTIIRKDDMTIHLLVCKQASSKPSASASDLPVSAPTPYDLPVSAPTPYDLPVSAPTPYGLPVSAPTPCDLPVSAPTPSDLPVSAPSPSDLPVTAPTPCELPVSAPTPSDLPVSAPSPSDLPVSTPTPSDLPVSTPTPCDLPVSTPTPSDLPVSTPTPCDLPVPAPSPCGLPEPSSKALETTMGPPPLPSEITSIASSKGRQPAKCPHCPTTVLKKNLSVHITRRHTDNSKHITKHLKSICVDAKSGISAVQKTSHRFSVPVHVQRKTWGKSHSTKCEVEECLQYHFHAQRSGLPFDLCEHIRSVDYSDHTQPEEFLDVVLDRMVACKLFGERKKAVCLKRQKIAQTANAPFSVLVDFGASQSQICLSIHEPSMRHFSRLGRVIVTYNKKDKTWHCPCAKPHMSCPHMNIGKWHLFQTNRHLFTTTSCPVDPPEQCLLNKMT